MALKDLIDGGKCLLGFHQGDWRMTSPDRCELAQTCERCGVVTTRIEHAWGDWGYAAPASCDERRTCRRCDAHETRVGHAWGAWSYVERHRAPVRRCERCGTQVSAFIEKPLSDRGHAEADDGTDERPPDVFVEVEVPARREDRPERAPAGFAALRAFFEEGVASGTIAPDRQPLLRSIMAQLEESSRRGESHDLDEKRIAVAQTQQLMQQMGALLMHPSRGAASVAPPGSRQAALTSQFEQLYRYVTGEVSRLPLNSDEGKAVGSLLGSLKDCRDGLHAAVGDDDPVGLEAQSLRQAAMDVRNFSLRQHVTVIHPIWPSQRMPQNPNAVFYSGGAGIGALLTQACEAKRLAPLVATPHREQASLRWDQLRECAIAVFDFTGYRRTPTLDEAAPVAGVAYELGIALTLGRPVLLLAHEGQVLPFDLDVEPIRLAPGAESPRALAAGLDHVLYGLQRGTTGESVSSAARYLKARYGSHSDFHVRISLESLTDETVRDPIRTAFLMSSSLMFIGADAPSLVYPPWPGAYPDPATPLCFHVTPFAPEWAADTRQMVSEQCSALGITYVRGDMRPEEDIIRSIWTDLCRATHVIVDVTGLNPNVALELVIAHTLGRNVRLITQDDHPERAFTAIAKRRVHRYALGDGGPALGAALEPFLRASQGD